MFYLNLINPNKFNTVVKQKCDLNTVIQTEATIFALKLWPNKQQLKYPKQCKYLFWSEQAQGHLIVGCDLVLFELDQSFIYYQQNIKLYSRITCELATCLVYDPLLFISPSENMLKLHILFRYIVKFIWEINVRNNQDALWWGNVIPGGSGLPLFLKRYKLIFHKIFLIDWELLKSVWKL